MDLRVSLWVNLHSQTIGTQDFRESFMSLYHSSPLLDPIMISHDLSALYARVLSVSPI